jgi:hypothetical protein
MFLEYISIQQLTNIYHTSTLKDSLEHRLKREGYAEGTDLNNKIIFITLGGKKLLEGWIVFFQPIRKCELAYVILSLWNRSNFTSYIYRKNLMRVE